MSPPLNELIAVGLLFRYLPVVNAPCLPRGPMGSVAATGALAA